MEPGDVYKLLYLGVRGPEHIIGSEAAPINRKVLVRSVNQRLITRTVYQDRERGEARLTRYRLTSGR
jgi:hypothetical protein